MARDLPAAGSIAHAVGSTGEPLRIELILSTPPAMIGNADEDVPDAAVV